MKRVVFLARTQKEYEAILLNINAGWVLDLALHKNTPYLLADGSTLWFLVFYDSEAEILQAKPKGEFDDVISVKDVPPSEADIWIPQGYVVHSIFAKNLILVKRK